MQAKLVFTLISLLSLSAIWGQTTILYTGLNTPVGIEAHGNDLYIAELFSNRIVKLDVSSNSPSLQLVSNINGVEGLALEGNNLRITDLSGSIRTLNVLGGIPTTTYTYHNTPGGVGARAITYNTTHGLYVGTAYQGNSTRIYKINSATSATLITTISGTDVRGMVIIGNYLYATQRNQGRIYRIDLTQVTPTPVVFKSGINLAFDLEAIGNKLYITTEAGKLYKIDDVTINNPPLTTLISGGLGAFAGLEIINQDIYISGWANGGRILKYTDTSIPVSCFAPTNIVANTTQSTATINWSAANYAVTYDLIYALAGQPMSSGTTISGITGTSTTITGLTFGQSYDVYVRTNCSNVTTIPQSGYSNAYTFLVGDTTFVDINATGNNDGTSWQNAYNNLNTALLNTSTSNLWIANGTYKPSATDRNARFYIGIDDLKIYGGFSGTETSLSDRDLSLMHTTNATILSGDLLGNDDANVTFNNVTRTDNSYTIIVVNANDITLDGLIVSGGYANATTGENRFGAGIKHDASKLNFTLKHLIIKENVGWWAAGISIGNSNTSTASNIIIESCIFDNNLTWAGASTFYVLPSVNCTINFNMVNSLIKNNQTQNDGTNLGRGSSAGWLRAFNTDSKINSTLVNNTFSNNINGGTFSGSDYGTLGLSRQSGIDGTIGLSNNIFWGNVNNSGGTAVSIGKITDDFLPSTINVYNSIGADDFFNIPNTTSVLNTDPLFTDAANGDYTLQSSSPAIDGGDNSKIPTGILEDLLGHARIFNTTVDMGVYEFGSSTLSVTESNVLKSFRVFPNPTKGNLYITTTESIEKIEVYNYIGQKMIESNQNTINTNNLTNGMYLLKIYTNRGKVGVKRFIKQ